jgi:hypothetical protein
LPPLLGAFNQLKRHGPANWKNGQIQATQKAGHTYQDCPKPKIILPGRGMGLLSTRVWNNTSSPRTGSTSLAVASKSNMGSKRISMFHLNTINPKSITKIMGVRDAKAMRPKPSVKGSRPRMVRASPTPKAVTSGTVTVEVVTPPKS